MSPMPSKYPRPGRLTHGGAPRCRAFPEDASRGWQTGGVRVHRTFGFVDLCGFTALTDVRGDEDAVGVLAEFRVVVREVGSRRGVRVAKWLGDGAMFVSVDAEPLVAAVLEIEERMDEARSLLPLRAGLSAGDVILFEGDDYIGAAVNLAARLCDLARAHEVLVSPELAEAAPAWAVPTPAGPVYVPGFAHAVPVVLLHHRAHPALAPHEHGGGPEPGGARPALRLSVATDVPS